VIDDDDEDEEEEESLRNLRPNSRLRFSIISAKWKEAKKCVPHNLFIWL
jgi:hypothetical protein